MLTLKLVLVALLLQLLAGATSSHDMVRVLQGEDDLFKDLRLYVAALERKARTTRLVLEDALARLEESQIDPTAYVESPLVAFSLVRRMHMDAGKILNYLKQDAGADLQQIADYRLDIITEEDLAKATQGLLRQQQLQGLSERDVARGLLGPKQYNASLSTPDCLTLAQHLLKKGEDEQANKWLELALELYEGTPERVYELLSIDSETILRDMVDIHASRENWLRVRAVLLQMLELAQDKQHILNLLRSVDFHLTNFEICRGQRQLPVSDSLRCRYNAEGSPFLRLAPLKLEQLSIDPYVALCHNAIHDNELEYIIEQSRPYLKRALVDQGVVHEKRVTMDAAFDLNASTQGRTLRQRLEDMSGFDLSNSDQLAVLNYGIGGHYSMHFDCWSSRDNAAYEAYIRSNRIATILLYLNEVQLGGITSFPALGLGVQPIKGSALIWHNMNHEIECDYRTLHAACPTLLGNRWVATQWVDVDGQWRRKRCTRSSPN
ncbi:PREDICTED: prolyl 4-hydroxylase subunit alpha-2 [Drosophila arizonae]|uniref:procollagen-proline 4-dioxygenase n=1 Tax=Drosophila arizonae TaxID=7263 RepID=A0ABM1NNT7_DROAR|nr:PREDICTED: prolyl 4-hydroxylase subunit alpha-2 [Drosophila arizonae]